MLRKFWICFNPTSPPPLFLYKNKLKNYIWKKYIEKSSTLMVPWKKPSLSKIIVKKWPSSWSSPKGFNSGQWRTVVKDKHISFWLGSILKFVSPNSGLIYKEKTNAYIILWSNHKNIFIYFHFFLNKMFTVFLAKMWYYSLNIISNLNRNFILVQL